MTEFLLAGTRQPQPGGSRELALAAAARRVVQAAAWYGWMRRWGLLLSHVLPREPRAGVRACLVVAASDEQAAQRLAAGWATVSGYQVAVLALTAELARETGP
jgi:hypothetical protein